MDEGDKNQNFDPSIKKHIIAHRGYWNHPEGVENSPQSLRDAINLGIYGCEIDVWQTADGVFVVNHDGVYNGFSIVKYEYQYLKQHISNKGDLFCIEEFFTIIKEHPDFKLVIEIKEANIQQLIALIEQYDISSQIEFFSFSKAYCQQIIEMGKGYPVSYLGSNIKLHTLCVERFTGISYQYQMYLDNLDLIREAHNNGLTVYAWTVNVPSLWNTLLEYGVDYIITDNPLLCISQ